MTVSMPGTSVRPQGRTGHDWQYTRGQTPNWPFSYFSAWELGLAREQRDVSGADHCLQASACEDVALMYETVEDLCGLLYDGDVWDFERVLCTVRSKRRRRRCDDETGDGPGSTSRTISIASFQKGTIELRPVRLKSSSINSSATSQKYSWPGMEQNHAIQVRLLCSELSDERSSYSCGTSCSSTGVVLHARSARGHGDGGPRLRTLW